MIINKSHWSIEFDISQCNAKISGGKFGTMELAESPLFCAEIKELSGDKTKTFSSDGIFKNVACCQSDKGVNFCFDTEENITFIVEGTFDDRGISWKTEIKNNSDTFTIISASYPVLKVKNEVINVFLPQFCGRELRNYAAGESSESFVYPAHWSAEMQYYAFYNDSGGVYMGIHDAKASMKTFNLNTTKGIAELIPHFPAIGASLKGNSFSLGGYARWEYIEKDWYDASLIYAEFVHNHATWLPKKGDNGRCDTPERFKNVPLWVVDYIPNSPKQMDARPMILGTVSQLYDADYWFEAAIELKKHLGVPLAYHVYNWHEIPFNINYPHYTPAKDEFQRGLKRLKEAGIYVLPYINAVSWETKDADEGFDVNFDNTGIKGAAIKDDGTYAVSEYPQVKGSGEKTLLAPICPGFTKWHNIIGDVVAEMETSLDIDGVYFDEIAAHRAYPCLSHEHNHLPGGGSHWSDNYNLMMAKIRKNKPKDNFYFTESNCEGYMKEFDGMLTWLWKMGDMVPAFPCIYSGYVQMIGRFTDGLTRDNIDYFRFHLAQELVFGQQLGWIHPEVIYKPEKLSFLKKAVDIRCKYSTLFNSGKLLRPPHITSDIPAKSSADIVMEQVQSGLWQTSDGLKKVLFVINVSEETANCKVESDVGVLNLKLAPCEFYVREFEV